MRWLTIFCALIACAPTSSVAPTPSHSEAELHTRVCPQCFEIPVPALYAQWWHNIEQCTGLRGRMDKVDWELAPKPILRFPDDPGLYLGMYFPGENIIILGLFRELDSTIVGHEMAHALMDQNGVYDPSNKHPAEIKEKCGNAVGPWQ